MNNAEQRSENTHTSGNLRLQADDTFEPLLSTMIETFESIYPKATIGLKYQAQEQAFQDLVKGNTDMLIAGRPLNQFEIDNVQKAGLVPKVNQLASDALVFICSKKNPAKKISEEKIAEILKGKQDIQLVCDKSNSGNLIYLKNKFRLSGEIKQVAAAGSDSSVIEYVAGHPNAIGIIGMALVSDYDDKKVKERLSKIKLLSVQYKDSSGKLLEGYPVQEELATQNYPFIRGIFVINLDGRKNIGTGFANFMVSERGQRIILKSGLLPFYMPSRDIQINTK